MPRPAAATVEHLTEEGLAKRWKLDVQTIRLRRRNGDDMPPHLPLSDSATNKTIRYRLADVEAWESARLVGPAARASA